MMQGVGEGLGELLQALPWLFLGVAAIAFAVGWLVGWLVT